MNTVWILGAGASISHSNKAFPSTLGFLEKAKSVGMLYDSKKKLKPHLRSLNTYLDMMFRRSLEKGKLDINIEELLTYLEIDIERERSAILFEIREIIDNLIRELLSVLAEPLGSGSGEYSTLAGMLQPDDSVLTFNWDLLLDNELGRLASLRNRSTVDNNTYYGRMLFHQMATVEGTIARSTIERPVDVLPMIKGSYIKLHGSIDWVYCDEEGCRAYRKVFPVLEYRKENYCLECYHRTRHLLILPLLNKRYGEYPSISKLWRMASLILRSARKVVVWGYSLPPTDTYSRWLLSSMLGNCEQVAVINPSNVSKRSGRHSYSNTFLSPYFDIFKRSVKKEQIKLFESFGDFVDGQTVATKYGLRTTPNV